MGFLLLVLSALLEVGGDAAIRQSKNQHWSSRWLLLGAMALVSYGLVVNVSRLDFNKLMGTYIVVFFVVSQTIAYFAFQQKPTLPLLAGGSLVLLGGAI